MRAAKHYVCGVHSETMAMAIAAFGTNKIPVESREPAMRVLAGVGPTMCYMLDVSACSKAELKELTTHIVSNCEKRGNGEGSLPGVEVCMEQIRSRGLPFRADRVTLPEEETAGRDASFGTRRLELWACSRCGSPVIVLPANTAAELGSGTTLFCAIHDELKWWAEIYTMYHIPTNAWTLIVLHDTETGACTNGYFQGFEVVCLPSVLKRLICDRCAGGRAAFDRLWRAVFGVSVTCRAPAWFAPVIDELKQDYGGEADIAALLGNTTNEAPATDVGENT